MSYLDYGACGFAGGRWLDAQMTYRWPINLPQHFQGRIWRVFHGR